MTLFLCSDRSLRPRPNAPRRPVHSIAVQRAYHRPAPTYPKHRATAPMLPRYGQTGAVKARPQCVHPCPAPTYPKHRDATPTLCSALLYHLLILYRRLAANRRALSCKRSRSFSRVGRTSVTDSPSLLSVALLVSKSIRSSTASPYRCTT